MNEEEETIIRGLRKKGFAVIIWTPEELCGVSPDTVETRCIELGHEVIECLCERVS